MRHEDAVALIADAVRGGDGVWADLGAGSGTFTRALVSLLDGDSRVYAIDRDAAAVAALSAWAAEHAPNVVARTANLAQALDLAALTGAPLDGILLANALHFLRDPGHTLARLVQSLRPGGRVVLVEYDRREASRWVPHPIPISGLPALADTAGLGTFTVTASRPSRYEGVLYAAVSARPRPGL